MLQSLQPHRPQVCPSQNNNNKGSGLPLKGPLYQQQLRTSSSSFSAQAGPQPPPPPPSHPRSQIEAMPPTSLLVRGPPAIANMPYAPFDPSKCHPVFFTPTLLRKPPFPMFFGPTGNGMASPVAFGYIAESGLKKEGNAKL